jgi:hypothetical protein
MQGWARNRGLGARVSTAANRRARMRQGGGVGRWCRAERRAEDRAIRVHGAVVRRSGRQQVLSRNLSASRTKSWIGNGNGNVSGCRSANRHSRRPAAMSGYSSRLCRKRNAARSAFLTRILRMVGSLRMKGRSAVSTAWSARERLLAK